MILFILLDKLNEIMNHIPEFRIEIFKDTSSPAQPKFFFLRPGGSALALSFLQFEHFAF